MGRRATGAPLCYILTSIRTTTLTDEKPIRLSEAEELPPEIQETLDRMHEDPNYGVRWSRLRRKPEASKPEENNGDQSS